MGLSRGKAQNILLGFLSTDGTEESTCQRKIYVQKKREGDKKVSIKKHSTPRLRLGGLRRKKGRTTERANNVKKYRKRKYMEQVYLFS
jgi:hypothetical protein